MDFTEFKSFDNLNTEIIILDEPAEGIQPSIVKFISQAFANPNEFVLRMGECRLP